MRTLNSVASYIKKNYKSASVKLVDDFVIVDLHLSDNDNGWEAVYKELISTFTRDGDIKEIIAPTFCVGMGKSVESYMAFSFSFYVK